MSTTYNVRIYDIVEIPSTKVDGDSSWRLRWRVEGRKQRCSRNFATYPGANSFRSDLLAARNAGEPFDIETGLPLSILRKEQAAEKPKAVLTHFRTAQEYTGMKWADLSGKSRETTAGTLTAVTMALFGDRPRRPADDELWGLLYSHAFAPATWPADERPRRVGSPHGPAELTTREQVILDWIRKASIPVHDLATPKIAREALDALKVNKDGSRAAESYFRRRRGVLSNYLTYLVTEGVLELNPLDKLNKTEKKPPKAVVPVDPAVAFSPTQGIELLIALTYVGGYQRARGRRLVVFFALVMFGALRPEEALGLTIGDCELPETGWGKVLLHRTKPTAGKRWTDSGNIHDDRGLKGRGEEEVRSVAIPPILVGIIRAHIAEFGTGDDGRIVKNERGGVPVASTLSRAWKEARPLALTPAQVASNLAKTPYAGRHAAVSYQLAAGMDPADIAQRAGNSIEVLLRIYAKFIAGQDEVNNRKVDALLGGISFDSRPGPANGDGGPSADDPENAR